MVTIATGKNGDKGKQKTFLKGDGRLPIGKDLFTKISALKFGDDGPDAQAFLRQHKIKPSSSLVVERIPGADNVFAVHF